MLQILNKADTHYRANNQRFNQPLKWPSNIQQHPPSKTQTIDLQAHSVSRIIYTEGYIEIQINIIQS